MVTGRMLTRVGVTATLALLPAFAVLDVIDTAVYRGGDMLSSWLVAALRGLGLGLSALSFVAMPIALAWLATEVWLGQRYRRARERA